MTFASLLKRTDVRLFGLAVVVRLLFVALFPGINYYDGITREYLNCAHNLLSGHGLTAYVDVAPWNSGRSLFAYEPFVGRPIGYVLFLALAGLEPVVAQILQAFLTAGSVLIVYKLALELFATDRGSERAAISSPIATRMATGAALLAAVWPNQARFEIALLPDGLTTLVMLSFALFLTRYLRTRAMRPLISASIVLGLSIFLRPDLVLFPAFFFIVALVALTPREALRGTIVMGLALALTIGINTLKNYALSGEIVPLNLGSGTTMYEGISQFGDTLGTTYADERLAHYVFNTKELFYPNGVQNDRMAMRTAIDTIKHHPGFYASVILRRIPLLFTVRGLYFSDTASLSDPKNDLAKRFPGKYIAMFREHPVQAAVRILSPLAGWLVVILGFVGLAMGLRRERTAHLGVALLLFYFIVTHLATNVEPRYFYPAVPLLYPYVLRVIFRRSVG